MQPLSVGEFAPRFAAPSRVNPQFHFGTVAGRYVLLAFLRPGDHQAACAAFETVRPLFDDRSFCAFFISSDASFDTVPPDQTPGLRWFLDPDDAVREQFPPDEGWLLLDPFLRVLDRAPLDAPLPLFDRMRRLPPPGGGPDAPNVAPALIVPRVFDAALCRTLIDLYQAEGGQPSGVMRDVEGRTVGILDPMKSRRDVTVTDPDLKARLLDNLNRNLVPMIARTFQFKATRLERYLIACYDAQEGGYFRPHRDNESFGTAHRRFAVSINLNAEEFEGGDLRFPEFGRRTYRPPTGGAVVFCCAMLHEATPVTRGRRYAFLPFLYDEAGQVLRDANLTKLAISDPVP
jgi:predicted 2-oxoglutarate/Fe(II)-dependent dioxygenase YbiX